MSVSPSKTPGSSPAEGLGDDHAIIEQIRAKTCVVTTPTKTVLGFLLDSSGLFIAPLDAFNKVTEPGGRFSFRASGTQATYQGKEADARFAQFFDVALGNKLHIALLGIQLKEPTDYIEFLSEDVPLTKKMLVYNIDSSGKILKKEFSSVSDGAVVVNVGNTVYLAGIFDNESNFIPVQEIRKLTSVTTVQVEQYLERNGWNLRAKRGDSESWYKEDKVVTFPIGLHVDRAYACSIAQVIKNMDLQSLQSKAENPRFFSQ